MKPLIKKSIQRLCYILLFCTTIIHAAPNLLLAQKYQNQDIRHYAMSEKLDGMRTGKASICIFSTPLLHAGDAVTLKKYVTKA